MKQKSRLLLFTFLCMLLLDGGHVFAVVVVIWILDLPCTRQPISQIGTYPSIFNSLLKIRFWLIYSGWSRGHSALQTGLKLTNLLPQSPKYLAYYGPILLSQNAPNILGSEGPNILGSDKISDIVIQLFVHFCFWFSFWRQCLIM